MPIKDLDNLVDPSLEVTEDEPESDEIVFICERCKKKAEDESDAETFEFTPEEIEITSGLCPNCSGPLKKLGGKAEVAEELEDEADLLDDSDLEEDLKDYDKKTIRVSEDEE